MKFYHFRKRWTTTKQAVWPSSVEESASDIEEFSIAKSYTFELISYTFFFVAIIIMASGANEENALHFRNAMKEVLFSDSIEVSQEFKVDYENFLTTAEFWSYFGNNLFSNLFNNGTHNDDEPGFRFLENNVIMGPPRLRQLRVRNGSCHVHSDFISYFSNCYSAYSSSDEEKEEKFHGWELGANVYKGEVCTYYGGGYVIPLTYNLTEIQDIFQDLERNQWIDRGTRLVLVEFSILNNPANLLASIKASAEFLATGGFVNSHRIETVELFSIFSDNNFSSKFLIFTIFVLSLIQISANVNTIFSVDGATRVKNPFNTISLWICLILWPCALYEYCHHYYVRILAEQLRRNPDEFVNLDIIVFINNIYLHALALSSLMLGIKFLRIMSLTRALFPFTTTIATCWRDICGFMVIYTIIVLAFVRLGLLLFGENSADFKDYEHTFFHILRCLNGEYDYLQLEHKFGWSASLFFITFTILLYFIFFNMFVAILSNAYKKGTQGKLSFFRFFSIFGNKWVVPQVTMIRQMLKQLFWRKWLQKHDTIANMMAKADFDDFPEYDQEETSVQERSEKETLLLRIKYRNEEIGQLMETSQNSLICMRLVNLELNKLLTRLAQQQKIYELTHPKIY